MSTLERPRLRSRVPLYPTSISLREPDLLRLEAAADAAGLSRNAAMRQGILAWVEQQEAQRAEDGR
jgi:predicted transcriptional regulator